MQFGQKALSLDLPRVMGILNVTPDSFSDGGQFNSLEQAIRHADKMLSEGADMIDVGGESTRPGAQEVGVQEELDRVIPVIEAIRERFDTIISVDTSKPEVMTQAVQAGAGLINDVRALQVPGALQAAAKTDVAVCLMHMQGQPKTMQQKPQYDDVVEQVSVFLKQRIQACEEAGIDRRRLVLDPGFGFGKTLQHNYQLLHQLAQLKALELPILAGLSRKSMLGKLLQLSAGETQAASLSAAVMAMINGARILRVHDVAPTAQALRVAWVALDPSQLDD
ncbi:Dihydropteroate synthase [Saliniradius amylolyticus]|uniref:Dihydropteroate synthase n=1 Tax=Saliniradius amylolyticus TaxID=2183582 RepID=A0A2S2E2N6_9ALTE|nr:dihydropteroate synthase [Saliniradius amylolyticus]AWL11520.1 Dihydropteroate synthase [Saliniradius amylolyticus]